MFYLQEFEISEDEGLYISAPFDLEGGTQGASLEEVMGMSAEWLCGEVERSLMTGERLPSTTMGNTPRAGGRVVLIGVNANLGDIPSCSASEAARRLGVSRPRVSKMLETGLLEGWRDGRNTRVTLASIEARLASSPRPGRKPGKALAETR